MCYSGPWTLSMCAYRLREDSCIHYSYSCPPKGNYDNIFNALWGLPLSFAHSKCVVHNFRFLTISNISCTHIYQWQAPKKVGFRAVVVSPTRELAQQTYRELCRLSTGSGFKVHVLTKAKANANSFGPQSTQRFGKPSNSLCWYVISNPILATSYFTTCAMAILCCSLDLIGW